MSKQGRLLKIPQRFLTMFPCATCKRASDFGFLKTPNGVKIHFFFCLAEQFVRSTNPDTGETTCTMYKRREEDGQTKDVPKS